MIMQCQFDKFNIYHTNVYIMARLYFKVPWSTGTSSRYMSL